jgi:hypothetical protein
MGCVGIMLRDWHCAKFSRSISGILEDSWLVDTAGKPLKAVY